MATTKLSKDGESCNESEKAIEYARIDAAGARKKIKRAVGLLDLLLETVFLETGNPYSWGEYYLLNYKETAKRKCIGPGSSETERQPLLDFVSNVTFLALIELEDCFALTYFDEAKKVLTNLSSIEKAEAQPVCLWDGPDISILGYYASVLEAINEGVVTPICGLSQISASALVGLKVTIEGIRNSVEEFAVEIDEHLAGKQAA